MERGNLSRRGFMQASLTTLAAAGLPAWYAREVFAAAEDAKADSERYRFGVIGIGSNGRDSKRSKMQSRARQLIGDFTNNLNKKNVDFTAACDVDAVHLEEGIEGLKKRGYEAKAFKDFRQLNDQKNVDVVIVATPDQWHALAAIDALRKGKDVYCEKPMTLTVAESQALRKVVKGTDRVFMLGNQQRSDNRFRLACELVRNGRIGKIKRVEARIGDNPQGKFKPAPVPEGLDFDFWLGPCQKVEYVPELCHYHYRWNYAYSGGKMTDWGAHHLDIAQWGLGRDGSGPVAVEATQSTVETAPHSYNCPKSFVVTYTYDDGTVMVATDRRNKKFADKDTGGRYENGVVFEGEDGKWIFVNRGFIEASDKALIDEPLPSSATRLQVSQHHQRNFLDCMKSRGKPITNIDVAHSSTLVCHIGVIALQTGKKLKWDPVKEEFDDADANKLLSRPMREPWKLDV